jgi:hypothetical protein
VSDAQVPKEDLNMPGDRTSKELVKSLRDYSEGPTFYWGPICQKAAEEIERLQRELAASAAQYQEACDDANRFARERDEARASPEPADVYVMKPSEAAVFEKVSRQRRVITPVFELCNAYESGIGHGLQKDDAVNPYPPRTQNAEAYQIGYEEGARRASLPPSDDLAVDVAGALERIRVKETLVEVYLMAHGRTDNPAYWAGFETACDEIAVRLQEQYGEEMTAAEAWVCSSVTKSDVL